MGRVPAQLWVKCVELRMEGRRIRVGAAAPTFDVVAVDVPQELDVDDEDSVGSYISFFHSFSFDFLELGLGGGLSAPSSSWGFPAGIPL